MTRARLLVLIPLLAFLGLAVLFFIRLGSGDPSTLPSALIGKPAPDFDLPPLDGLTSGNQPIPGLKRADLLGHVSLVNVFASWCGPCRIEHPVLQELAKDKRFHLVAINYKDKTDNARQFLEDVGNPYAAIGVDARGRTGIDWGVYGVPETFLIGDDGVIRYKFVGPLTDDAVARILEPEIEKALRAVKPP